MHAAERKNCSRSTSARVTRTVVTEWSRLSDIDAAWSSLLARSATDEPTLSPLWLGAWWNVFGRTGRRALRCILVTAGDELIGLAPLLRRTYWYHRCIPVRRVELVGSGEDDRDEICSEYIGVAAVAGAEQTVAEQIVDALLSDEVGCWDELVLPSMDAAAPIVAALEHALSHAEVAFGANLLAGAPYIPLPSDWSTYLRALPSSSRYLLRRTERDLTAWAGRRLRWHRAESPAELADGAAVLRALHRHRWSGGGAFGAARFDRFHELVMPELLARGALDLSWITVGGEPVGALYNLVWNDKVYYYQSGRRTDLPVGIRPGIALHAAAIRRAIAAGRREYDFLAGTQRFKRQLALAEHPIVELRVTRRGVRTAAVELAGRGARAARARARKPSTR